ncbi:MarR family winged helix-turn-helix transcriptional regulator [Agarivorans sp. MS3-6]|uniref:MarR family winged helix-turn-helix transcriptional regulator n=1 Tax=Agarivorans sp. TSD2052 TaxID=2937286 RepID=UPI00201036CA|nr:MarR family transcriptional regulator [Agarivorans sp. TSD2052]UPW18844.1 MarR family transcriptional regulator [Agarivorans sp. TSD2052]
MKDPVDNILQQWGKVKPDMDCSAMGIIGRLRQVNAMWQKQLDGVFEQHNLSSIEFDILATLRRSQVPLTPTELYKTLMLSSGAVSTWIEKLVQRGLIERIASQQDRRSCKVKLTEQGTTELDEALDAHIVNMDIMLNMFDAEEKNQLAALLKKGLLANA